jgi:hypothetical protein
MAESPHLVMATRMWKPLLASLTLVQLIACSSLPDPRHAPAYSQSREKAAKELLEKSAARAGYPWRRLQQVEVAFDGQWTSIVKKLQPELVDAGFRKTARDLYRPREGRVEQTHRGPDGVKQVLRTPESIAVSFNGKRSTDETKLDAAALVTDAYAMFVFGADWLLAHGSEWKLWLGMKQQEIAGEPCSLVFGKLKPGVGRSEGDEVIAWISQRDQRLLRVQFTLNGLESTVGADVDVTFSEHASGPRGTEWPRHFLETVRRPLTVKAHEWRMTELKAR